MDDDEKELFHIQRTVGSSALAKACMDYFYAALQLKSGQVIYFTEAELLNDEWIHLKCDELDRFGIEPRQMQFARGVDVRLSEIVWVADAPHGS